MTVAEGKGGWITNAHTFSSGMGHAFFIAIIAWVVCFVLTAAISMVTTPRPDSELKGLVYSLTEKPKPEGTSWYHRPGILAIIVLMATIALNFIYL
jgi:SSS family solute:Na+ symporter